MSAESESPFVSVPLYLENGDAIGIKANIPRFVKPPEVLIWGTRVFLRWAALGSPDYEYRECFAVTVVDTERA